jgi:hypothetical protein
MCSSKVRRLFCDVSIEQIDAVWSSRIDNFWVMIPRGLTVDGNSEAEASRQNDIPHFLQIPD